MTEKTPPAYFSAYLSNLLNIMVQHYRHSNNSFILDEILAGVVVAGSESGIFVRNRFSKKKKGDDRESRSFPVRSRIPPC